MHANSLMKRLLKIDKIVTENVYFEEINKEGICVIRCRPPSRETHLPAALIT